MNTTASVLALALGLVLQAQAEAPKHVRVCTQYIEVPHATLSGWLNGEKRTGQEIHSEAVKLATNGGAKILEANIVVCRSGEKATIESIREEIYPTEYEPPELPCYISRKPRLLSSGLESFANLNPHTPTAFETRNTGVILEVEPTIGEQDMLIDLRFVPEIVTPLRLETCMEHIDKWGDASIRMPVYETWRSNTAIMLVSGKFELVSVITPKVKTPSPLIPKRILLFIRADVVTTPLTDP